MAKFKVGDRVKVKGAGVETIKAVYPKGKGSGLDSTQVDMSVDWYETDGSGMIADEDIVGIANSRACNSTNPVVANAMRARNATYQYHDYDVPVIQLGHRKYITIMGVADEETAKAIVRSKPGLTIDESRKVKVKNACGGVANAMAANGGVARNASEYETYMRFVKKYENEIKRVTMTLENFARECPSGATIESEADQVARMAKDVMRWIIETKTMSPADFDEF